MIGLDAAEKKGSPQRLRVHREEIGLMKNNTRQIKLKTARDSPQRLRVHREEIGLMKNNTRQIKHNCKGFTTEAQSAQRRNGVDA
jgi:sRNA-binding carbon storage regulator CsrA